MTISPSTLRRVAARPHLPWRLLAAVGASVALAAMFAAIGAALWLSALVGALAGTRILAARHR